MTGLCKFMTLIASTIFVWCGDAHAEDVPPFRFERAERAPRSSFAEAIDPLSTNGEKVQMFVLDPSKCIDADCQTNSARASMKEDVFTNRKKGRNGQPSAAWYSWEVYFPKNFPYGQQQARGGVQFASFKHNVVCASIYLVHQSGFTDDDLLWRMTEYTGASPDQPSEECKLIRETRVARMRDLLGKWTRFELFVRWSNRSDGEYRLYVNGEQKISYEGRTCVGDCLKFNQFNYGIYLSNAPSRDDISKTYVLFKNVDRAANREELAINQ